jgi:hypothetical protein
MQTYWDHSVYCFTLGGYGLQDLSRGFESAHERFVYLDRVLTNRYCQERIHDLELGLDYGWPEAIPYEDLEHRINFVMSKLDWYELKYFMMPIIKS